MYILKNFYFNNKWIKIYNGIFYIFLRNITLTNGLTINRLLNAKTFQSVMRQVLVSIICNSLFRRTIPHQFRRGEIINQRAKFDPRFTSLETFLATFLTPALASFSQLRRRFVNGHNYKNCKDTHADIRKGAKQ